MFQNKLIYFKKYCEGLESAYSSNSPANIRMFVQCKVNHSPIVSKILFHGQIILIFFCEEGGGYVHDFVKLKLLSYKHLIFGYLFSKNIS